MDEKSGILLICSGIRWVIDRNSAINFMFFCEGYNGSYSGISFSHCLRSCYESMMKWSNVVLSSFGISEARAADNASAIFKKMLELSWLINSCG